MMRCAPLGRFFLLLLAAFFFAGCTPFKRGAASEEKDPHFLEGKKRMASMDWDGAIESFERALQSNPNNSMAHLELGMLYDNQKHDPGEALHHYQKHLRLRPDSPMSELVTNYILGCKRELAKSVSLTVLPGDIQRELQRYAETNSQLQNQINLLRAELARRPMYITNNVTNFVPLQMPRFEPGSSARLTQPATIVEPEETDRSPEPAPPARSTPAPSVAAREPRGPAPQRAETKEPERRPAPKSAQKTHTVRPGDTLEVVARKYGVSVSALKAANPSARNGTRAGQRLIIPD